MSSSTISHVYAVCGRRAYPERKPLKKSSNVTMKSKEERMQGILNYRNIHLKVFGETPMADLEIILPDKKVGIRPFALLNLMITVVGSLVTGTLMVLRVSTGTVVCMCVYLLHNLRHAARLYTGHSFSVHGGL